jgi:four helix bundle protein
VKAYPDCKVFQDSHELNIEIQLRLRKFPRHEMFALTNQMRRAASSVPMNIAEGSVKTEREFRHALTISLGSAAELEYQLLMARDLSYLQPEEYEALRQRVVDIRKMLTAFIRTIDRSLAPAR